MRAVLLQGGPETAWYSWLSGEDLPKPDRSPGPRSRACRRREAGGGLTVQASGTAPGPPVHLGRLTRRAGGTPNVRLYARQNAASDWYPYRCATADSGSVLRPRCARASWRRQSRDVPHDGLADQVREPRRERRAGQPDLARQRVDAPVLLRRPVDRDERPPHVLVAQRGHQPSGLGAESSQARTSARRGRPPAASAPSRRPASSRRPRGPTRCRCCAASWRRRRPTCRRAGPRAAARRAAGRSRGRAHHPARHLRQLAAAAEPHDLVASLTSSTGCRTSGRSARPERCAAGAGCCAGPASGCPLQQQRLVPSISSQHCPPSPLAKIIKPSSAGTSMPHGAASSARSRRCR